MIKHTHINMWAERCCRSVGMHPPEGAVPVREPLLWFREINNSFALVYFLSVLSHRFFPVDAGLAEDFSISIPIPSPEFLIWFSETLGGRWGASPSTHTRSLRVALLLWGLGVRGLAVWLTFCSFYLFCDPPVSTGVGVMSVKRS